MISMMNEGDYSPTAQQVASRADVTMRTVFRHFSDMDSLYAELDASIRESYQDLFAGGDRSGSLEERVLHAVETHAEAYIKLGDLLRAVLSLEKRSPAIQNNYSRAIRNLRKDLDIWLPELLALSSKNREAVDAVASFEFWDRLYTRQKISKKDCISIIEKLILNCLVG
jgi:AcrR family transcriptional regulator